MEGLPYDFESLTEDLRRMAEVELFETNETRTQSLRLLRNMIRDRSDMYSNPDDDFLLAFLRARKYDVKRALASLHSLKDIILKRPDLFQHMDPARVEHTMIQFKPVVLPIRDKQGRCVMIIDTRNWNPPDVSQTDVFQAITCCLVHSLRIPATQVAGLQVIYDAGGLNLRTLLHIDMTELRLVIALLQGAFPIRIQYVHVVNENPIFDMFWAIVKFFISKKMRDRFLFHGKEIAKLHEYIPRDILPTDYGSKGPPIDTDSYRMMILDDFHHIVQILEQGRVKPEEET